MKSSVITSVPVDPSTLPQELVAKVVHHNGGMSLEINGEIQPFTSFKIAETPDTEAMLESARVEIPGIAREGISLCWIPIFVDWSGPGQYDFSDMDRRIQTVLDLYDQHAKAVTEPARIVVRVQAAVFTPPWYIEQAADENGKPTNLIEYRTPWGGSVDSCSVEDVAKQRFATQFTNGSTLAISPGDSFWDTHAVDCLKAIIDHVRTSAYAHRVFGWLPCAFNTNEWFLRTFVPEASCDFSEPTQLAFRDYLRSKGIECDDEPVPLPIDCKISDYGEFLDPSQPEAQRMEEFSLWLSHRFTDIILSFAKVLKTAYADSPKLIGFFYGYSLGLSRLQNLSQCGQLSVGRLLDSEDIDFICSPNEYCFRADEKPFTGSTVMGPFADSGACCNKLVFLEDDHCPPDGVEALSSNSAFSTRDTWHDEMFFRHTFAQMLSSGQQLWWYSLQVQWFKEASRQEIVGDLHRIGKEALERDRGSVAEVAVVIDERSISTMRFNPRLQQSILTDSHGNFFPSGAPFKCFELQSFLHHADHDRFKVVVFLNLFRVDQDLLDSVKTLKSDGRTLMFFFAPGLLMDRAGQREFSTESASELVGMNLAVESKNVPLTVWIDPDRVSLIPDRQDVRYGWLEMDTAVQPLAIGVDDEDAEPLGFLHSGRPGFATKKHKNWTSVYSAAPCLPTEVLRVLLKRAGVHVYTDGGDVIYANKSMLACVASSSGSKILRLPHVAILRDVFDGSVLIQDANNSISITMKRHETRIFWMEAS